MPAAWIAAGTAIYGLTQSGNAANSANNQNNQNIQAQQQANNQNDPFSTSGSRSQYVPMLNQLAQGGPSSVANDPTYQAMNANSMQDMSRGMAASGQGGSGQAMIALQQNSQQNQMSYWQQMMSQYSSLSGASSNTTAATGQSPNSAYNQTQGMVNNTLAYGAGAATGLSNIYGNSGGNGNGGSSAINGNTLDQSGLNMPSTGGVAP